MTWSRRSRKSGVLQPEDEQAYVDFLDYSRDLFEKTSSPFLYNPLYEWRDLKEVNVADLAGIDALSTVSKRVDQYFSSEYLRKFFKRFATYNGSSPYQSPATLNVIPHVEINRGGFYVKGGLYRIAFALRKLAEKMKVEFNFNSRVTSITTKRRRATGIEFDDGSYRKYDLIVSNADAYETYRHLLPNNEVSPLKKMQLENTEPSCSGFVLLLGIDRQYEQLRHHNVFFSENYEAEFDSIFNEKRPAGDPTIYIANTSHSDADHAPRGGSNLFILVNAPYLSDSFDWSNEKEEYADLIKNKMENRGMENLRESIEFEKIITPADFYHLYRSNRGSIYGTSSNSRMAAFMRPANKARGIDGLYLTGGSTHPGGGIPLVILSARHAYELIKRYER
ncbi:MAG: phytoene desaturase family protein [Balneolaceae bacterium]|nr:phytoene desaturase family protein [Balneolaceae bacterium]